MSLIADLSTITSCLDGAFQLILPECEEEAFPRFSGACTIVAQQDADFTVTLPPTLKLTTFPRWQPNQLSSHSFDWCASSETLSIHEFALIPSA